MLANQVEAPSHEQGEESEQAREPRIAPGKVPLAQRSRRSPAAVARAAVQRALADLSRVRELLPSLAEAVAADGKRDVDTARQRANLVDLLLDSARRGLAQARNHGATDDQLAPGYAELHAVAAEAAPLLARRPPSYRNGDDMIAAHLLGDKDAEARLDRDEAREESDWQATVDATPADHAPGTIDMPATYDESRATISDAPVQRRATGEPSTDDIHAAAAQGISGTGSALPHLDTIQRAFGSHDVTGIIAHVGGPATAAATSIGAEAYATGNHVAFSSSPDLFTAAHEAAHVVQQRAGVHLLGGVGAAGDTYEQHADAVAAAVVRGESASSLLGTRHEPVSAVASIQRREANAVRDDRRLIELALRRAGAAAERHLSGIEALSGVALARVGLGRAAVAEIVPDLEIATGALANVSLGKPPPLTATVLGDCIGLRLALGTDDAAEVLRTAIATLARVYVARGGDAIDLDHPARGRTPALSASEQREVVQLLLRSASRRLHSALELDGSDSTAEQALLAVSPAVASDLADAARSIAREPSARARSAWGEEVENVSATVTRVDRWVRAGKLAWNAALVTLFEAEGALRGLVGAPPMERAQSAQRNPVDVAREAIPGGEASSKRSVYSSKREAVGAIVGAGAGYVDHMRQICDELEDALQELPPRHDAGWDRLIEVAVEGLIKGSLAGLATHFVAKLGAGVGRSTQDALRTGLREVARGAMKLKARASGPERAAGGGDSFVMTNPRNAFISLLGQELSFRKIELTAALAAQMDELESLDLVTLQDAADLLTSTKTQEEFRTQFVDRLIVDWMNFSARWTSGATNSYDDAHVGKRVDMFPELSGVVVLDVDLSRSITPGDVVAQFQIEPRVRDTLKQSKQWKRTPLAAFPVHRVYMLSLGAYNSVHISMGPSAIPDIDRLTQEDVQRVRDHRKAIGHEVNEAGARKWLLEVIFAVNENTIDELLR